MDTLMSNPYRGLNSSETLTIQLSQTHSSPQFQRLEFPAPATELLCSHRQVTLVIFASTMKSCRGQKAQDFRPCESHSCKTINTVLLMLPEKKSRTVKVLFCQHMVGLC